MAVESRFGLILCLLQPLFPIVFGLPNKVVVVMAITSWHCPDAMRILRANRNSTMTCIVATTVLRDPQKKWISIFHSFLYLLSD